jgi:hypothetical protein
MQREPCKQPRAFGFDTKKRAAADEDIQTVI